MSEEVKKELVRCHDDAILLICDNGEKLAIRQSNVTAVRSDSDRTTIYFQGHSLKVKNPMEEVIVMIGLGKYAT